MHARAHLSQVEDSPVHRLSVSEIKAELRRLGVAMGAVAERDELVQQLISRLWREEYSVLMVDLGGGTLDVSLVTTEDGICEIKALSGANDLGGDDFTRELCTYACERIQSECRVDLRGSPPALQSLWASCELAKRRLSNEVAVTITVTLGSATYSVSVSRAQFEAR